MAVSGVRAALSLLVAAAVLSACGGDGEPRRASSPEASSRSHGGESLRPESTTVSYGFRDSSVDPEYHRSFQLTVADGVGTVVVDSYGDETARDERPVDPGAVADLVTAVRDGDLAEAFGPMEDDAGCAGGRSLSLTLDDGENRASTAIHRCGGTNEAAAGQLIEAMEPLLAPFDIAVLTEGRYP